TCGSRPLPGGGVPHPSSVGRCRRSTATTGRSRRGPWPTWWYAQTTRPARPWWTTSESGSARGWWVSATHGSADGDDQHPAVLGGQRRPVLAVAADLCESGLQQPVSQLGEGEQAHEVRDPAHPPVPHHDPFHHVAAGERVEPVIVNQQIVSLAYHHRRKEVTHQRGVVVQLQQEPAAGAQHPRHLGQHPAV